MNYLRVSFVGRLTHSEGLYCSYLGLCKPPNKRGSHYYDKEKSGRHL